MSQKFFINNKFISEKELQEILSKPDWYIFLHETLKSYQEDKKLGEEKEKFIYFFAEKYKEGEVSLGSEEEFYFDNERKPIDTVVIHHTSRTPEVPILILETIHLLSVYSPKFLIEGKQYFQRPIFSGHFRDNQQTFFAYHYIVYSDGSFEQILKDEYVGWHCGNWDYNCRSIGIAIHDDLEEKEPTPEAIETVKKLIQKYNPKEILGHREISKTTCPGNMFLGNDGWKKRLIL